MNAERQAKANQVKEINSKISSAKSIVIAEYAGLSVQELQMLRKEMQERGVEAKVYKNRLFKIAANENNLSELEASLTGPNLYIFGNEDDISPAKITANFAKEHEALKIKAGTYEGKVVDAATIAEIATLPSLEEALTMLATSMISPIKYVGTGLHMLIEEGHLGKVETEAETKVEAAEAPKAEEISTTEEKTEVPKVDGEVKEETKEEDKEAAPEQGENN